MKHLFYLMLVVLGTAAFTACSDDDDNNGDGNNNGNGTITLTVEGTETDHLGVGFLREGEVITVDWGDGTIKTYESALDVDKQYSIDLKHYYADGKNSHTIIIQGNGNITEFWYEGGLNNLISIDVSECTTLSYLVADSNLKSLDVSKNTNLTFLSCGGNELTSLDVSKNTALTYLDCGGNQLTSLDISKNTKLTELECNGNPFTSAEMNKIYEALPTVEKGILYCNELGNPDIAEQKGWEVHILTY